MREDTVPAVCKASLPSAPFSSLQKKSVAEQIQGSVAHGVAVQAEPDSYGSPGSVDTCPAGTVSPTAVSRSFIEACRDWAAQPGFGQQVKTAKLVSLSPVSFKKRHTSRTRSGRADKTPQHKRQKDRERLPPGKGKSIPGDSPHPAARRTRAMH